MRVGLILVGSQVETDPTIRRISVLLLRQRHALLTSFLWLHLGVNLPRTNYLLYWKARNLIWKHSELLTENMEHNFWWRCNCLPNCKPSSCEPY